MGAGIVSAGFEILSPTGGRGEEEEQQPSKPHAIHRWTSKLVKSDLGKKLESLEAFKHRRQDGLGETVASFDRPDAGDGFLLFGDDSWVTLLL